MLMAAMKPPAHITPHGEALLSILRRAGDQWLTRTQIAQSAGRSRLTPYDISTLDFLAIAGEIEVRQAKRGLVATRFEYKAKS